MSVIAREPLQALVAMFVQEEKTDITEIPCLLCSYMYTLDILVIAREPLQV